MSLLPSVLEHGGVCWNPYREGQIKVIDRAQKTEAKYANHTSDSVLETLAHSMKVACFCTLFKAYTGERAWNATGDRLPGPCYLNREDKDRKLGVGHKEQILGSILLCS